MFIVSAKVSVVNIGED